MKNNKENLKNMILVVMALITTNRSVDAESSSSYETKLQSVDLLNVKVETYFHNKIYANNLINAILVNPSTSKGDIISSTILDKDGKGTLKLPDTLPEAKLSEVLIGFLYQLGCHIKTSVVSDKGLRTSNILSFQMINSVNHAEKSYLNNARDVSGIDSNGYGIESGNVNDILVFANRDGKVKITAACDSLNINIDLKLKQGWNVLAIKDKTSPNYNDGWNFISVPSNSKILSINFLEMTSKGKLR